MERFGVPNLVYFELKGGKAGDEPARKTEPRNGIAVESEVGCSRAPESKSEAVGTT